MVANHFRCTGECRSVDSVLNATVYVTGAELRAALSASRDGLIAAKADLQARMDKAFAEYRAVCEEIDAYNRARPFWRRKRRRPSSPHVSLVVNIRLGYDDIYPWQVQDPMQFDDGIEELTDIISIIQDERTYAFDYKTAFYYGIFRNREAKP